MSTSLSASVRSAPPARLVSWSQMPAPTATTSPEDQMKAPWCSKEKLRIPALDKLPYSESRESGCPKTVRCPKCNRRLIPKRESCHYLPGIGHTGPMCMHYYVPPHKIPAAKVKRKKHLPRQPQGRGR